MTFLSYIGHLFSVWFDIFGAPLKNFEMLWVIIPVYLTWIFTEIYQEKKYTSLGNAISNGTVVLWAGIDWVRHTFRLLAAGEISFGLGFVLKLFIAILVLSYGFFIIFTGIKVKKITHYIGRIREVSYVLLMFTPIFYEVVPLSWETIFVVFLFMPLFYFFIEIIDRLTPNPKTYSEDKSMEDEIGKGKDEFGGLGEDLGKEPKGEDLSLEGGEEKGKKSPESSKGGLGENLDEEMKKLGL